LAFADTCCGRASAHVDAHDAHDLHVAGPGGLWLLFDVSGGSFEAGKALAEGAHDAASAA
jgi:hypothetical protein